MAHQNYHCMIKLKRFVYNLLTLKNTTKKIKQNAKYSESYKKLFYFYQIILWGSTKSAHLISRIKKIVNVI